MKNTCCCCLSELFVRGYFQRPTVSTSQTVMRRGESRALVSSVRTDNSMSSTVQMHPEVRVSDSNFQASSPYLFVSVTQLICLCHLPSMSQPGTDPNHLQARSTDTSQGVYHERPAHDGTKEPGLQRHPCETAYSSGLYRAELYSQEEELPVVRRQMNRRPSSGDLPGG